MKRGIWLSFQGLDTEPDIQPFIRYLDRLRDLAKQQDQEQKDLSGLTIRSGDRVLDVGCGVGHETQNLARIVGPSGKTCGCEFECKIERIVLRM